MDDYEIITGDYQPCETGGFSIMSGDIGNFVYDEFLVGDEEMSGDQRLKSNHCWFASN